MYTGSQKDPTRTDNDNLTLSPGQNFLPSPLTPQTHFGMVLRPITGRVSSNESNRPNLSLVHDVSPLPSPQIVQQPASRQRNHLGVLDNEVSTSCLHIILPLCCSALVQLQILLVLTSSQAQGSTCADLKDVEQLRVVIGTRDKQISKLSAQFDCLRNSHEAHLSSLTVTHSKELHDLGVYTDALQKQTSLASDGSQGVSNAVSTTWHLLNDDQSPGGHSLKSMQSFQSALELHRNMAQEYAEQNESLKAQLEAADKRVLEAESVRIERDYLEHTAREARSQVETALAQLSGSQMQEKALQNEVDRLTARLDEVNTMRIDVLEANHELEEQMKQIAKCQKSLAIEVGLARCHIDQPAINTFQAKLKEAEERAVHLQQKLETVQEADEAPLSINVLAERVKELEKMLQEKGDLIREWGKEKKVYKPDVAVDQERGVNPSKDSGTPQFQDDAYAELVQENEALVAEISELKDKMVEKKKLLRRLEADRQKVAHLLYAELRRQAQCSNGEAEKSLRVSLSTKRKSDIDRMMADIQARARNATGANREPYELATEPARRVEQLEKEIEYHVKDIVLYRLDVKGYRKDIKCATATIERLQDALSGQVRAQLAASPRQIRARSSTAGLGLVPNTAQASPSTPISASPSPGHVSYTHRNASAASSYPNTPLATHKKLPCPPAPTTPPLSSSDTATPLSTPFNVKRHVSHASVCTPPSSDRPRRVGTQRSLSESIISSYARRTPERTPEFLKPSSAGGVVLEGRRGEKKKKGRKGMAGGCDPFAAASGGAPVPPPLWEVRVEGKEVDA